MKILGFNYPWDAKGEMSLDGGVALLEDGVIKTAYSEERISRKKYDSGFRYAMREILDKTGLTLSDIDYFAVSFYAQFYIPENEVYEKLTSILPVEGLRNKLIFVPSHHLSHAALSYYLSPFKEALIIVADNEGSLLFPENAKAKGRIYNNCERNSYYFAKNNVITSLGRDFEGPNDIAFGKAYSKFTRFIGFGDYHGAGKTMGLSAYGNPQSQFQKHNLWDMSYDGKLSSLMYETFESDVDIIRFFASKGIFIDCKNGALDYDTQEAKDLALFIQTQLNRWMAKKAAFLMEKTQTRNVCISGGVALNGVMNSYLEENANANVFVAPYPGDCGQGLGNAIYAYVKCRGMDANPFLEKVSFHDFMYLGAEYTDEECLAAYRPYSTFCEQVDVSPADINRYIARRIHEGKIVGVFRGRSEFGARALGNRSIVAKPTSVELRDTINIRKGRELFRPLAPSVLSGQENGYFDCGFSELHKYMLGVVKVKDAVATVIPGVTHADGTARIQIVDRDTNPEYYDLIHEYHQISGVPLIINTSFNCAGEPIVETPLQAFASFLKMELDYLICNHFVFSRKVVP